MRKLHDSWKPILTPEFKAPYFLDLVDFIKNEYEFQMCYPPKEQVFNAFTLCPLSDLKVVIIGQDPYHGIGQANGLSFSVNDGIAHPPSLVNIFKELQTDLGIPYPKSGDLSSWASQGVLLLNATLTVRAASCRLVSVSSTSPLQKFISPHTFIKQEMNKIIRTQKNMLSKKLYNNKISKSE